LKIVSIILDVLASRGWCKLDTFGNTEWVHEKYSELLTKKVLV